MKLEQTLISMGRTSSAIQSLSEWADQLLPTLQDESDVYGDVDTVELASEHLRVCFSLY